VPAGVARAAEDLAGGHVTVEELQPTSMMATRARAPTCPYVLRREIIGTSWPALAGLIMAEIDRAIVASARPDG